MSTQSEIAATRAELAAVRNRMSDTAAEIGERVSDRVDAVKDRINPVQVVRDNPWPSLAMALGAGIVIAATGADRKAASAVADASRTAARASADAAKSAARSVKSAAQDAADSTTDAAHQAPSRTRSAIVGTLDSLAAKLAVSLIDRLREPEPLPVTPEPGGLGYVETTKATGSDSSLV